MSKTTELTVPQLGTRRLSDPASTHTIADRKYLTEDALKLSEHELKKEFVRRVNEAQALVNEAWESMDPYFVAYNKAAQAVYDNLVRSMSSDIEFSFNCLNRMQAADGYGGRRSEKFQLEIKIHDGMMLFWCSDVAKGYRDDYHRHLNKTRYRGVSAAQEIVELVKADEAGSDLEVFVSIYANMVISNADDDEEEDDDERQRDEVFDVLRVFDATGSTELMNARIGIATAYAPYAEAVEKLRLAKEDVEKLPEMMKELEMQATAQRLQDAGGQSLLMNVLHGVSLLLKGEQISGLHLAVPETQNIMGAPEEHGPESETKPETPVVESAPAVDEAPGEETAAPAAEAAAEETPTGDATATEQE